MVRYFVNYEDFLESKEELDENKIFIKRKNKNNEYYFISILDYPEYKDNILNNIKTINYKEKGILFVELDTSLLDKFDSLIIKKYEETKNNKYKKICDNKITHLIKYNCFSNIKTKDFRNGHVVALMPCLDSKEELFISGDRENLCINTHIRERRNMLHNLGIGCDLYFHTEDEDVIDKFKDQIVSLKETDKQTYKLENIKLFVIDSIPRNRIYDFTNGNYNCLTNIMYGAIPVRIKELYDGYDLDIDKILPEEKKGYIITIDEINTLIYSKDIEPLIKYINIYELKDNKYYKTSLNEYLKNINILKYTRREF